LAGAAFAQYGIQGAPRGDSLRRPGQ
jgi:hypothetical protein